MAENQHVRFYIGQHESQRSQTVSPQVLGQAQAIGYDLLTTPITTDQFQSKVLAVLQEYVNQPGADKASLSDTPLPLLPPLAPSESNLAPDESNSSLIGVVSCWIDIGSPDPLIAHISKQVLNLEISYASFCGICNILVPFRLQGSDVAQYSRAIAEAVELGPYLQLHVSIPMWEESDLESTGENHLSELVRPQYLGIINSPDHDLDGTHLDLFANWEDWDFLRSVCNYSPRLTVALEIPRKLPDQALVSRWCSEPVRLLVMPRTSFLRNAKGHPVLSKEHQALISTAQRLRFPPWILLVDVDNLSQPESAATSSLFTGPTPAEAKVMNREESSMTFQHLKYVRHLEEMQPSRPPIERFGHGYQDYLQSPLQPLADNLESITYEVFEKDPIKYEWYERAISEAIQDLKSALGEQYRPVVAVVGAGRGPLVTRVLQASKKLGSPVHCCAVEKNPNAYVLIQRTNITNALWGNSVMIFKSDMRNWAGPVIDGQLRKVDILVSELLGSFADNELSPECLDGVQRVLDEKHGVNIPQSYTAHLTPLASPRIHSDLLGRPGNDKWEIPYVVMLHQYDFLCTSSADNSPRTPDIQLAWQFSHPIASEILSQSQARSGGTIDIGGWTGGDGVNEHNARSCCLRFQVKNRGICHGLAGYFETVLYAGSKLTVELSTNPINIDAKSKDMISWFPIFFPLKTPLNVPDNSEIQVDMWRNTDDKKVWYEWLVTIFKLVDGRRSRIGMSQLHSSQRNGCLL